MDYYGTKRNGKQYYPPVIAEQRRVAWDKIPEGSAIKTSLVVPRDSKTHQQVKAHWGMVIGMAIQELDDRGWDTSYLYKLPKPTGIAIKGKHLQEFLYAACPIHAEDGRQLTLSKMDTQQASQFFEACRAFLASQWSIVIPDPNKNWRNT
jgi:hypothetical protein